RRRRARLPPAALSTLQFLLSVYGGYFGGAVGIMMMAVWSLLGTSDLKLLNPLKTLLVAATNAIAVLCFIVLGAVSWSQTLVLLGASVVGGYTGARLARRLQARHLRRGVIGYCFLLTLAFFVRAC
ncbi:MAG: sulfite exporter TauE/SafE family protein, partial [Cystobacter sp.]